MMMLSLMMMSGDDDVVDNGEDSVETLFLDFLDPMYSHQTVMG